MRRWLLTRLLPLLLLLLLPELRVAAQDPSVRAFNAAARTFDDGFHELAQEAFLNFVATYPSSPLVPEALLRTARAAFLRTNYPVAIGLLSTNLHRAGPAADRFLSWLAEARLAAGQFEAAAADFARLLRDFTNSPQRLEASLGEARARFELRQWHRVADALLAPDGDFQQQARRRPDDAVVIRGRLLLAEALLEQGRSDAAAGALAGLPAQGLPADLSWRREFLICRQQMGSGRLSSALSSATNLLQLASSNAQPVLIGASQDLLGRILEQSDRPADALAIFERNLGPNVVPAMRREAFARTVSLALRMGDLTNAIARLESYHAQYPGEAGSDVVLLTSGQLRLHQHAAALSGTNGIPTNAPVWLQLALTAFDQILKDYPSSPLTGRAQLGRGWALLANGNLLDAQAAFKSAAESLPPGPDQAVARFKLGDVLLLQHDTTNAVAQYRLLTLPAGTNPPVPPELVERAHYQVLQAALTTRDATAASNAVQRLLTLQPDGRYGDRSLLLYGQALSDWSQPSSARRVLTNLVARFPGSVLLPEVRLAVAGTYEREGDWLAAGNEYDRWITSHPGNPLLPSAEYRRALSRFHNGDETNALALFIEFLGRHPTNEFAPMAREWIGDHHHRNALVTDRAEEFSLAETSYQLIAQNTNWPLTELTFRAQLKAGRTALRRQGYEDAISYFTNLLNDVRCPTNLLGEAYFLYGDAVLLRPLPADQTNKLLRFEQAIPIYGVIPRLFPGDPLAAPALGQVADCYFQLAPRDIAVFTNALDAYTNALETYQRMLTLPLDVATRSQAEIGIARVYERQARLAGTNEAPALIEKALRNYLKVVHADSDQSDPYWTRRACLAAAELAESQRRWAEAANLYKRLAELVPSLRSTLERKLAHAREHGAGGGN